MFDEIWLNFRMRSGENCVQKCVRRISVNLVDLVESFQTSIYLQTSVLIQPRTGLSKLANNKPEV